MKQELIKELFGKFEAARYETDGVEFWSARDLQYIFNYSEWRNLFRVIEKAKQACNNAGEDIGDHFVDINKMVSLGSGAERKVDDFALTRYACYLIAQNGDSVKPEISFAQTYFALQTRKQELIEQRLLETERVIARDKLMKTEKKLSGIIYERGVDDKGFAIIRSKGDEALFGGYNTSEMKSRLGIPFKRPLADFLPALTIKAKDFATELTSHNVIEKNLYGEKSIKTEHIENNIGVRSILLKRGVKPENLSKEEDLQKVKRKLGSDEKKILKDTKKLKKKNK